MSEIDGEAKQRVTFFKGSVAFTGRRRDPFRAGPQDQIVGPGLGNQLRTGEIPAWNIGGIGTGFL